jgi:hypothetical protein
MIFQNNTVQKVDFTTLTVGQVAKATLTGLSIRKEYLIGRLQADGRKVEAIIGHVSMFEHLIRLKGAEVEIEYTGTRAKDGITYPSYSVYL